MIRHIDLKYHVPYIDNNTNRICYLLFDDGTDTPLFTFDKDYVLARFEPRTKSYVPDNLKKSIPLHYVSYFDNQYKILIYPYNTTVYAELVSGDLKGIKMIAFCNPYQQYNFFAGAQAALESLDHFMNKK